MIIVLQTSNFTGFVGLFSFTIEDGWNPCCHQPNCLLYELFKTSAGNEYLFVFSLERTYIAYEIGRNDVDFSRCVKYKSGTEFDYAITKVNEDNFELKLYNDTTGFTCFFVKVKHVTKNTEIKKDIDNPSDIDDIANHLMALLKTAQIPAK